MSARRRAVVARQWALLRELQTRRFGLRSVDLARRLGASRATVDRDLATLRDAGFAIERVPMNGEIRHRLHTSPPPPLAPTPAQASALRLARLALRPLEGTEVVREIEGLIEGAGKAGDGGPERRDSPGPVPYLSQVPPAATPASIVRTLDRALHHRRQVELRYRAASRGGRERGYRVEPLRLRMVDGDLYLCAYVPARKAARTFKTVRIAAARLLDARAAEHPEWSDERLFGRAVKIWSGAAIDAVVRLSPEVAHVAAEYPLVPDQELEPTDGGGALVRARVAGVVEASRWVLSWGAHAEALAPPPLRAAVRAELEGALRSYRRKPARRAKGEVRSREVSGGSGTREERGAPRRASESGD